MSDPSARVDVDYDVAGIGVPPQDSVVHQKGRLTS
jgi:hypothetical protein